jgi:hypothetical protein
MNNKIVEAEVKKVKIKSSSPYERLSRYVDQQQQELLKIYSVEQLAAYFTDSDNDKTNATTLADAFLKVGLRYGPADFVLTGLEIKLSKGCDEVVYKVEFESSGEKNTMILHSEIYQDGRRYTVFSVIQDIYSGIKEEIDELQPDEWEEVDTYEIRDGE